jgi:hypothetical protein
VGVSAAVEKDQVTCPRWDDRAVTLHRIDAVCVLIVSEDEIARPRWVIGAEEQPSQWVRVHVTFESHPYTALDVQHQAVASVMGRSDGSRVRLPGQLEKVIPVETMEPWQSVPHLIGVNPAAGDMLDLPCFAG